MKTGDDCEDFWDPLEYDPYEYVAPPTYEIDSSLKPDKTGFKVFDQSNLTDEDEERVEKCTECANLECSQNYLESKLGKPHEVKVWELSSWRRTETTETSWIFEFDDGEIIEIYQERVGNHEGQPFIARCMGINGINIVPYLKSLGI